MNQQTGFTPGWETKLNSYLYQHDAEKTYIDKVLNRQDAARLQELMKKEDLTRSELLELLYLLVGTNNKLVNFSTWDRYLLGKYLAWIRDFATIIETMVDYQTEIKKLQYKNDKGVMVDEFPEGCEINKLIDRVEKHYQHFVKFLADVFIFLENSTLGIGAVGFDTLTKMKYEYHYPEGAYFPYYPQQQGTARGGISGLLGGRKH